MSLLRLYLPVFVCLVRAAFVLFHGVTQATTAVFALALALGLFVHIREARRRG